MALKGKEDDGYRLRIDQVLVDKFRRLQGGINEAGTKIIRDLGLRYQYDKNHGTLDIIGQDSDILALAVETLRFWIENDEFPDTGITCQVGYPNRSMVIWRFHGDYAKKFDHLFSEDIAKLKLVPTVNIKAIPTKQNPEYVELYCHFSVFHKVKETVNQLAIEIGKICQDDFFVPKFNFEKAREYIVSQSNDTKILYALKEYPQSKIRVWIFARDQSDVIRARREFMQHISILMRDNESNDKLDNKSSVKSASFFGHPASALESENSKPTLSTNQPRKLPETALSPLPANSRGGKYKGLVKQHISPRHYDNPNFSRPQDFVYSIQQPSVIEEKVDETVNETNPFLMDEKVLDELNVPFGTNNGLNKGKWVAEHTDNDSIVKPHSQSLLPSRIYVHRQVGDTVELGGFQSLQALATMSENVEIPFKTIVHPEKNLVPKERYNTNKHSVLTSARDLNQVQTLGRIKKIRPINKRFKKQGTTKAFTRQKPILKDKKPPPSIRYNINVNGLEIFMYKQNIAKLSGMDCLVNVVDTDLKHGDAVCTSMYEECGKQVRDEIDVHISLYGTIKSGENVVTSAGNLPTLGIIHVASPIWSKYTVWEDCATDLHKAIYNVFKTAEGHKYRKIGLPTIGSEHFFGIPKDLVAEVYVKALIDYSLGMGPLYPVREVHIVDTDPQMLSYIKDAYESWSNTPGVVDMTKHIKLDTDNIIHKPKDVTSRAQSAVTLRSIPSHRSENMVTFVEQTYTNEGNQKWIFDILKRLTVIVYTGSILQLDDVDAIVCSIDANGKGSLAKRIVSEGGKPYRLSLKKATSTTIIAEGDILVTDAGFLPVSKVLHCVITTPIYTAKHKNMERLDTVNTKVFYKANELGIKRLAMPLIGTGRLRERFEVEQCSLQLVDNIIELCLSLGQGLKIQHLHLVNMNHVITQYLTQALRIRAHTKLMVETETHKPTRQDILMHAEAIRHSSNAAGPRTEEITLVTNAIERPKVEKIEENKSENVPEANNGNDDETKNVFTKAVLNVNQSTYSEKRADISGNQTFDNKRVSDKMTEITSKDVISGQTIENLKKNDTLKRAPNLSMRNIQEHNKLIKDAWMHLVDEDISESDFKHFHEQKKKSGQHKNNHLVPMTQRLTENKVKIEAKYTNRLAHSLPLEDVQRKDTVKVNTFQRRKRTHRIVQRSSDFVFQKSKAESYKSIYEKKQTYEHLSKNEDTKQLKKTLSSDNVLKDSAVVNEVLEGFKNERRKLAEQRNERIDNKKQNANKKEKFISEKQKIYVRDTVDRHKEVTNMASHWDEFGRENRLIVAIPEVRIKQLGNLIERYQRPLNLSYINPQHGIDNDMENPHMTDIDLHANNRSKRLQEHTDQERQLTDTDIADERLTRTTHKNQSFIHVTTENNLLQQDIVTGQEILHNENQIDMKSGASNLLQRSTEETLQFGKDPQKSENDINDKTTDQKSTVGKLTVTSTDIQLANDSSKSELNQPLKDIDSNDEIAVDNRRQTFSTVDAKVILTDISKHASRKNVKTYTIQSESDAYGNNKKPISLILKKAASMKKYKPEDIPFIQGDIHPIYRVPQHSYSFYSSKYSNINGKKLTKEALNKFGKYVHSRSVALKASKPEDFELGPISHKETEQEDVHVRDQLKLQIQVLDKKVAQDPKTEKEKQKIKRFWEVVGGKDLNNESELYGKNSNKDKIMVAKVIKERKISAKSKKSKQTNVSSITHDVGQYNVTLEVTN